VTTEGPAAQDLGRPLLRPLVRGGEITGRETLATARDRHRAVLAELPPHALSLARGYPAIPTVFEPDQPDLV
jgi:nicotinate phosphoribosyltransferase